MERLFEKKLQDWKNNGMKKPLMVIGVRQTGKTYIINKFGKENFEEFLSFDIEKNEFVRNIFEETIDDEKILEKLELFLGRKIDLDKTLFFFDEVQVSERFITSLKYFNESSKPYKIICAGSLLGVKLNRFSSFLPVGKIQMEYMYPLNFEEFLLATGKTMLRDKIKECYKSMSPMPDFAHEEALKLYRSYLCIGGMPEAVNNYVSNNCDVLKFDSHILSDIKELYIGDMKKYVKGNNEAIKIEKVYNSIPQQLAKEKNDFQYSLIESGARKRKYESALEWLVASKMVSICFNVKRIESPLKVYVDDAQFKLYLSDLGILTNLSELPFSDIMLDNDFIFKGVLTENYIAEELTCKNKKLYYWTSDREAEVDFLLSGSDGIIPIEVKSGNNIKSKSLNLYVKKYNPKYAIRFSTRNFGFENNIKSIPLYAAFCIE